MIFSNLYFWHLILYQLIIDTKKLFVEHMNVIKDLKRRTSCVCRLSNAMVIYFSNSTLEHKFCTQFLWIDLHAFFYIFLLDFYHLIDFGVKTVKEVIRICLIKKNGKVLLFSIAVYKASNSFYNLRTQYYHCLISFFIYIVSNLIG